MRQVIIVLLFFTVTLSNCTEDEGMVDLNEPLTHTNEPTKWWILAHPSGGKSGIYLYDEVTDKVDLSFDIPADMMSPHALYFDGESLWLGGMGDNQFMYELSPTDGSIKSKIPNIQTEGITVVNDEIYYSEWSKISRIKKDGTKLESFNVMTNVINDMVVHNSSLYVVVNGETDPVFLFDRKTSKLKELFDTEVTALYTLTAYDNYFIVVDDAAQIVRIDIGNNKEVSRSPIEIPLGWITAIAPYNVGK